MATPSALPKLDSTALAPASTAFIPPKRLIMVGGGKGGVGKSTFARVLIDYYEVKGLQTAAFDGDLENPSLSRFIDAALPLASQTASGFEALVNAMEEGGAGQIVADLGAGTQRHAAEFERVLGLAQAARDFGYTPVLVWLLAPAKDSIGLLGEAIKQHTEWSFVLARAVSQLGDWTLWDNSNTKKAVDAIHPELMVFPVLDARAFTACDKHDLRFKDASRKQLSYTEAAYTSRWFHSVCQAFDASAALRA